MLTCEGKRLTVADLAGTYRKVMTRLIPVNLRKVTTKGQGNTQDAPGGNRDSGG